VTRLIVIRLLAALALQGTLLIVLWTWWMNRGSDPAFLPFWVLRSGLAVVEGMLVTIALVLGPAVLAGRQLETAVAPDVVLPDVDGRKFALSSLRGQKVLLVAWAPY